MEKKIYEKPMVAVAVIESESFCATSGLDNTLNDTQVDGGAVLSKENNGFDLWGDDEE